LYAAYSCSPLDLTSFCKNAFADTVGPLSCNIYQALVVDILHEFELGVFKSVFRHLLRLLHAINPVGATNLIAVLDARYVCFHLSGLPTRSLLNVQVPSNPILRERCHSPLSTQCLRSSSVCRTTFRRCITGNYISHHKISLVNTSVCLSVQSLHLKDYFLPSTTRLCERFCSDSPSGMPLQSCVSTQNIHLIILTRPHACLVINYANSATSHAQPSRPWSCLLRRLHGLGGGKISSHSPARLLLVQLPLQRLGKSHSTSQPISSTHLGTMSELSISSAQLIPTQLNW